MLPSPEQYAAMLDAAADGGYAFPAVNVTSSRRLNTAMRGFAEAGSDGIVQITVGGARYLAGAAGDALAGARALAAAALGTGERGRYLLAATFGNVHGLYAPGSVKLRPEILADGRPPSRARVRGLTASPTGRAARRPTRCVRRSPTAS